MKPPRGLTAEEAALWARVAATVTPLDPPRDGGVADVAQRQRDRRTTDTEVEGQDAASATSRVRAKPRVPLHHAWHGPPPPRAREELDRHGLDSSWDRKLARGVLAPDVTIDLHGATLDAAHAMLLHGVTRARAAGARVVLLVTGKPRAADPADRASRRGAIRAKVIDWLAASEHASAIAAIRKAHPRHGGEGALYVVLRRRR